GGSSGVGGGAGMSVGNNIYVSPTGSDSNPGTAASPVQTLQKAQQIVRSLNGAMTADITVTLADGYYRMQSPLTLEPSDSGTNGHNVIWTAAGAAHPVLMGSSQITGWSKASGSSNIWVAQGPPGIHTRQLYVDGVRATRATGDVPTAATLSGWVDPSGGFPPEVEFVYTGGWGAWTEGRIPVASVTNGSINMVQPCWDNSTKRGNNNVGPGSVGSPTRAENAYELLDAPGEWYLDVASSKFYYIPLTGQTLATLDVEAPVLEALVTGGGTATNPLHDVIFQGIQFSYATWLGPSGPNGFSEVQANYLVSGSGDPTAGNAEYTWDQIPANVSLTYAHNIHFVSNAFVHLGAAGLALGNGAQNCIVQGNVVTDTSGNGIELGDDNMRNATGNDQTLGNTLEDNHVFDIAVEYHGGIGIDVGYAASSTIIHNQIDHTPYTGMSIGWGGWPDKNGMPGLTSYTQSNNVSYNLIFNVMQTLNDGGGIYTNGQTSAAHSFATGETVKGNVVHDLKGFIWGLYDDNGSDWVTVTGNAFWNPSGSTQPWGYCHDNYYPGEGGGLDDIVVQGNYWQGGPTLQGPGASAAPDAHCQLTGNITISGPAEVPQTIITAAGLEPAYESLLQWVQVPPPPVHS
ncbi:MAG TPA: right-handed parallel beta-helix repeat-containing protein, partial [Polyangiaceae bacterium]|nr:right-handed parallel beta-helix repeat-containing protein [Polyangiaceae bacterium]